MDDMKTIKELADEFKVSKQAIRKHLSHDFRVKYVQTITSNGVKTLVINKQGYLLLNKHFNGKNRLSNDIGTVTSNIENIHNKEINYLKEQLLIRDTQLLNKDEQLKSLHDLLDQQQQLQLKTQQMLEEKTLLLETTLSKKWWQFWK